MFIDKEDYEEPNCPFCTPNKAERIPLKRVLDKLDEYFFNKDTDGAVRHLKYWLNETESIFDSDGKLAILNEFVGLYRKLGERELGLFYVEKTLSAVSEMDIDDTVTLATTYLNVATAYKAFSCPDKALELYAKATEIYERRLPVTDVRLAGLYNNHALAEFDVGNYSISRELYFKALNVLKNVQDSQIERALTYCNLADLECEEYGYDVVKDVIEDYLFKARDNLLDFTRNNGDLAYAIEKCIPVFEYYGYKDIANILSDKLRSIYERS